MPTYEYECLACGATFEKFQMITDPPKRKCPACGKLRARRLISGGGGVLFRGAGFYQTDYRSAEYKKKAEAERKESSSENTKTSDSASDADKKSS